MGKEPNHPRDPAEEAPNHYLREWREFMGWSQEELADMAHVHQSKIQRVETGKRKLKTDFLRDLARVFGVAPSALLEVNPSTEGGARTASLLLAWETLSKAEQDTVLDMVQTVARRKLTGNGT